ncbi:MAG: regulatory protein RecX [Clostridia bacterium]|nr:regulatory protein RecX [Clostridia bacterium]
MNEHTNTLTISSVKRVHGRASLILSSGETLPMPRAMLKERPYRGGMPFDRAQFHAFLLERSYPFALDKAVSLLASRARTEKEIVSALRQNAYPEQTIARVMARLHDEGYINDAAFAGQWASARTAKGMGARRIRQELRLKGVSQSDIDEALNSVDEEETMDAAVQAAEKASRGRNPSDPADRQKIIAALVRRGYDFSTAKTALQRLMNCR